MPRRLRVEELTLPVFRYLEYTYRIEQEYFLVIARLLLTMSGEKRTASASFGSAQLVKRQKSNADLNSHAALSNANGRESGGAVIQAVSMVLRDTFGERIEQG